jgi:sterol desaturase/sphingolipid hydroxylase (fatty acid hydroxylase superfamily)
MDELHKQIILLFSIPIYAILIPLELVLSNFHGWKYYGWKETLMNVYLNIVNAGVDLLLRGVALFVLTWAAQYHFDIQWHPVVYWVALFFCEDIMFWFEHYVDHSVRVFWAVHVTHHSSEEYNLTTGFRSSVLMPFYRYLYFIPLAMLNFRPIDILFMYAITQIYGILVHTQAINKLPRWIEYIFVTPSHHRVHHASNTPYLDKNMGMVLIIWDRLFGTFVEEMPEEKPIYGITTPPSNPHHPVKIIFHEWENIAQDLKQKNLTWKDRLGYLFCVPGWSHDGSRKTTKSMQLEWHLQKQKEAAIKAASKNLKEERVLEAVN